MKRIILILISAMLLWSCNRIMEDNHMPNGSLPEGAPATLCLGFGNLDYMRVSVGTKAEASSADEARVHDLYVMIFNNSTGEKIYGRFFSYEHLKEDIATLTSGKNEGWWVENKTLSGVEPVVTDTRGVVKLSTEICHDAKVVLLANVVNAISFLDRDRLPSEGDSNEVYVDDISYLNDIRTFSQLERTKVILEQDIVNRKDLFLMMGTLPSVDTEAMQWNKNDVPYNSTYKIELKAVDAKVKFMVRCNKDNNPANYFISDSQAVYWKACNIPDRCYLFSDYNDEAAPDDVMSFDSENAYFEGKESKDGYDWYVFSFYMLESRHGAKRSADSYIKREKQETRETDDHSFSYWRMDNGEREDFNGEAYVENVGWYYAPDKAPFVQFDMILTLTQAGIDAMGGGIVGNAMTSDTIYSVHLGDFTNNGYDDYNTLRSHFYTYKIVIVNSGTIYAEVENDDEKEPGQEGFLILTNDEIVNADCHYAYHMVSFNRSPGLRADMFSWYVKTPFGEGKPQTKTDPDNSNYTLYVGDKTRTDGLDPLDYLWCKFAVNDVVAGEYTTNRVKYMGETDFATGKLHYDPSWKPSKGSWEDPDGNMKSHPDLMDISQLIEYIVDQNNKDLAASDFLFDSESGKYVIRVTIFIDEYYYEENPISGEKDPDLWRRFVNAKPREMHILSDARQSRDRASDVIQSSHSVIQQSIQTIYNIYAPGLRTLWGCEHLDEIKAKVPAGWQYWPATSPYDVRSGANSALGKENGRFNSAYIWNLLSSNSGTGGTEYKNREWDTYMTFEVNNDQPELNTSYQGLAFSCMTRNRDNNGNGIIDHEEVRWYLASSQQLIGLWVGNESLSLSARLYKPAPAVHYNGNDYPQEWRAHVVSSTNKMVCWSEEGAGSTDLQYDVQGSPYNTWTSWDLATHGESVRCLRNIGTYDSSSGLQDISFAPYNYEIDKYFTLETTHKDPSDPSSQPIAYTFSFDRLNTKSIREYSEGELPFHDQNSLTNRVYSKMITQNLVEDPDINLQEITPGLIMKNVNTNVTAWGNNPYCPPGYRFPNLTEWILMSLYLSDDYLKKDKDGNSYSPSHVMPSRTYYDRGYYGSLKSDTEPWSVESDKVGWIFSNKLHCYEYNKTVNRSRCVKDEEMTGHINGDISIDSNFIYPDDKTPITLTLSSTASTLTAASLKLCYNAHNGNYRELDIPVKSPKGLEYRETQVVTIPSLASLGLTQEDIDAAGGHPMVLKATAINAWGNVFDVTPLQVKMINPIGGSLSGDASVYPSDQGSVTFNFQSNARTANLSGATLQLRFTKPGESEITSINIPVSTSPSGKVYNGPQTVSIPSLSTLGLTANNYTSVTDMVIHARVEMEDHVYKEFDLPVTLSNPISGSIAFAESNIYPSDTGYSVDFDFSSSAHTAKLDHVTFKLCWGVNDEYTIFTNTIDSKTLDSSSSFSVPSLSTLGISAASIPLASAKLRAEVFMADGLSAVDEVDVTLANPVSGSITTADSYIYPAGSEGTATFDFHSLGHTVPLSGATLKLQYTPTGGSLTEYTLPLDNNPSTKDYIPTQTLTIPSLYALGLTAEDLPLVANIHAEVSDVNGLKAVDDAAVTIKSHYTGLVDITDGFDPTPGLTQGFPITISANSMTGFPIESVKLRWKQGENGSYNLNNVIVVDPTLISGHTSTAYWQPTWLNSTDDVLSDNSQTRRYYFTAVVGKYDGEGHPIDEAIIGRDAEVSEATMEFFKINYDPNPLDPNNLWTYTHQPQNIAANAWLPQEISNLNFASGDFIDTYLDVRNCNYAPKKPGSVDGSDLGMDNLISIGPATHSNTTLGVLGVEWKANNVLLYYPARNGSNNNLQIAVLSNSTTSRVQPFNLDYGFLRVLFKKENNHGLLLVNNFSPDQDYEPDWINEEVGKNGHPTEEEKPTYAANTQARLDNLASKSTLYVGSTEGNHRSRAIYKYVRVVRKHD